MLNLGKTVELGLVSFNDWDYVTWNFIQRKENLVQFLSHSWIFDWQFSSRNHFCWHRHERPYWIRGKWTAERRWNQTRWRPTNYGWNRVVGQSEATKSAPSSAEATTKTAHCEWANGRRISDANWMERPESSPAPASRRKGQSTVRRLRDSGRLFFVFSALPSCCGLLPPSELLPPPSWLILRQLEATARI